MLNSIFKYSFYTAILFILFFSSSSFSICKDSSTGDFTKKDFPKELPPAIQTAIVNIPATDQQSALNTCSHDPDYLKSMQFMEDTIAIVATQEPSVLTTMAHLNNSLLFVLEKAVTAKIKFQDPKSPPHVLQEKINKEVDRLLVEYYGQCHGSYSNPGCVGSNPKNIRGIFKTGNLRERSFLMLDAADKILTEQVFNCKPGSGCLCEDLKYHKKADWLEFQKMAPIIQEQCSPSQQDERFKRGRFAGKNKFFREKQDPAEKEHSKSIENFEYMFGSTTIPFSSREREFIDNHGKFSDTGDVQLSSGMSIFKPKKLAPNQPPDPENLYYSTAERFGFPIKVAPSGTTDSLLNFGCLFGMDSKHDMEALRAAAIGNMVIGHHHTAYEIMIAGKSFEGLDINPDFEYYKKLFPSNPRFEKKVESAYMKQHRDIGLPKSIYLSCIKAIALRNSTSSKKQCSPTHAVPFSTIDHTIHKIQPVIESF